MKVRDRSSMLDNLYIASPCSMLWDAMIGDERERSCNGCSKTIYNISDMSRLDAESFLARRGMSECITFYRRADGTIMTDDCPRALRRLRNHLKSVGKIVAGAVALLFSIPAALAQPAPSRSYEHLGSLEFVKPDVPPPKPESTDTKRKENSHQFLGVGYYRPPVVPKSDEAADADTTSDGTTKTVIAKIVTKKHKLSDGRNVVLVAPDADGNVVRRKSRSENDVNRLLDSRASDAYVKGQFALKANKFLVAEYYFRKSLKAFDSRTGGGDPSYRKLILNQLKEAKEQLRRNPFSKNRLETEKLEISELESKEHSD